MNKELCILADPVFSQHLTGFGHPEQPLRIFAILNSLKEKGLLMPFASLRSATDEEIQLCHSQNYLELVKREVEAISHDHLADDGSLWLSTGDVSICSKTLLVARLAIGTVLEGIDLILQTHAKRAFCAIRPPGHHASSDTGKGFCLFNNVAIGARYAQKKYGLKKILIADWDVHHGDGTQAIFQEDPSIFYFSTHRYGKGFYPGTGSRNEKGRGNVLNCPISAAGHPRKEVLRAFHRELTQAMRVFRPDFVMLSAGFDAHHKDPLGGFDLTESDFSELTFLMKNIADTYSGGRLISLLEGGYSLEGLASSVCAHVKALE